MYRFLLSPTSRRLSPRFVMVYIMLALMVTFTTYALLTRKAQSLTDNSSQTIEVPVLSRRSDKGYRAYMEYNIENASHIQNTYTANILRRQKMYVYAKAGDTICLGSDIMLSMLDENDKRRAEGQGYDIVLLDEYGNVVAKYRNSEEQGYIGTVAQEKAGVNYKGCSPDGYTPHEYKVTMPGTYEVRFHSYSGIRSTFPSEVKYHYHNKSKDDQNKNIVEPYWVKMDSDEWYNSGCTIGSFDISVFDKDDVRQKGRVFTKYLSINVGKNFGNNIKESFISQYHIVTNDGYIYQCDFNLDPFGFLFFANNHGIVDANNNSVYHSFKSSSANTLDIQKEFEVDVHNPNASDTLLNSTHMIFFDKPDESLMGILYKKAYEPDTITNVRFIGSRGQNITYEGCGGYFEFEVENAVSVGITIDFSAHNENYGTSYEPVTIRASVTPGTNRVFWDGNDGAGEMIPVGLYSSSDVKVSVDAYAGEIHFPLMDVENCNSFTLTRVNDIYVDEDTISENEYPDLIYYNNKTQYDPDTGEKTNNFYVPKNDKDKVVELANELDRTNGTYDPIEFKDLKGDFTTLDIWKYYFTTSEVNLTSNDIVVIQLDKYDPVRLQANVFLDANENGLFEIAGGDSGIENVNVDLDYHYCETRWIPVTGENGEITRFDPLQIVLPDIDGTGVKLIDGYYHDYCIVCVPIVDEPEETTTTAEENAPAETTTTAAEEDIPAETTTTAAEENEPAGTTTEPAVRYEYLLYRWDENDIKHEGTPVPVLENDEHVKVHIDLFQTPNSDGQMQTDYVAWIPVHKTTTTDSAGHFSFDNILINNNPERSIDSFLYQLEQEGDLTEDAYREYTEHFNKMILNVKNPNYSLYGNPTTSEAYKFGGKTEKSSFGDLLHGNDNYTGMQILELTDLEAKINADKHPSNETNEEENEETNEEENEETGEETNEEENETAAVTKRLFTYNAANVGYYYEIYLPPMTFEKVWSNTSEYSDISEITFRLLGVNKKDLEKGQSEENARKFTRDFTVSLRSDWSVTVNDLPAGYDFRIISESFVLNGCTYTYYEGGSFTCVDSNGDAVPNAQYPFNTTLNSSNNTPERMRVFNMKSATTQLVIVKTDYQHTDARLAGATFSLHILDGDHYVPYNINGSPEVTTQDDGTVTIYGLISGDYMLKEEVPPTGFMLLEDAIFFTAIPGENTRDDAVSGNFAIGYTATIKDYHEGFTPYGALTVHKMNEEGTPLNGAVFALYNRNAAGNGREYYLAAANGDTVFEKVALGDDGFAYNDENEKSDSEYSVNTSTGCITAVFGGRSYHIYPAVTKNEIQCIGTTEGTGDSKGILRFADLIPGTYILRELKAPDEYIIDTEQTVVELTEDTDIPVNIENRSFSIDLNIVKHNVKSEALSGAKFVMYYKDGATKVYYDRQNNNWSALSANESESKRKFVVSGASGHSISGLSNDRIYYLEEKDAPDGYKLMTQPIVIDLNSSRSTANQGYKDISLIKNSDSSNNIHYSIEVQNDYANMPNLRKYVFEDSINGYSGDYTNSVGVGQPCRFKVMFTFDSLDVNVKVTDILPNGFTLEQNTVKVCTSENGNVELAEENYTYTPTANGFTVDLNNAYVMSRIEQTTLYIFYNATPDYTAVIDGDGNVNEAQLRTDKDFVTGRTTTYIYSFNVFKCDNDDAPLADAKFVLAKEENDTMKYAQLQYHEETGKYRLLNWTNDAEQAYVLTSPEDGNMTITGVDADHYQLIETEAPEGYAMLTAPVCFSVGDEMYYDEDENSMVRIADRTVRVKNYIAVVLPMTGGCGTSKIYFAGAAVVMAALAGMIVKRRRDDDE